MTLAEIINSYIEKYGYKSYLEIGVRHGETYSRVDLKQRQKVCIDPNYPATHRMTSDEFFELPYVPEWLFDVILVDGLHTSDQVKRDIENSYYHLSDNGIILVHDVLPKKEDITTREPTGGAWTGDVWKGFLSVVLYRDDINYKVLNETRSGVGVIWKEDCPTHEKLEWDDFEHFRNKWLSNA